MRAGVSNSSDLTSTSRWRTLPRYKSILIPNFIFQANCSSLNKDYFNFINNNLQSEIRDDWRFLFSTEKNARSLEEMTKQISYRGPTILVVKDKEGKMFGAYASVRECFIFTLHPEMKVFHTKGGEGENCQLLTEEYLAMGGSTGLFLLLFSIPSVPLPVPGIFNIKL